MRGTPPPQGLYDGQHEHDACGVAFVATLHGVPSHDIVVKSLTALRNLDHRGASGAEVDSGDGAGILLQIPDRLFRATCDFSLPPQGRYAALPGLRSAASGPAKPRSPGSPRSPPGKEVLHKRPSVAHRSAAPRDPPATAGNRSPRSSASKPSAPEPDARQATG